MGHSLHFKAVISCTGAAVPRRLFLCTFCLYAVVSSIWGDHDERFVPSVIMYIFYGQRMKYERFAHLLY